MERNLAKAQPSRRRSTRSRLAAACAALLLLATACTPAMIVGIDAHGAPAVPDRTPATPSRAEPTQRLRMPVIGVRVAEVTGNFGAPRGNRRHEGVDIFAPRGTPVVSAAPGTVRFAGTTRRGGWTVMVRSAGWDIWYTHLEAIAPGLSDGMRVGSDALLGWVGTSGNASGGAPHLHFEMATAAGPIDPLPLLADRD